MVVNKTVADILNSKSKIDFAKENYIKDFCKIFKLDKKFVKKYSRTFSEFNDKNIEEKIRYLSSYYIDDQKIFCVFFYFLKAFEKPVFFMYQHDFLEILERGELPSDFASNIKKLVLDLDNNRCYKKAKKSSVEIYEKINSRSKKKSSSPGTTFFPVWYYN